MAPKKPPHRHYLLCPVCLKTQESLSCHLSRVCKKTSSRADIEALVEKAKKDVLDLLQNGRAFSYAVLTQSMADTNPLKSLIEELNRHHLIVTGAPPPLPTEAGPSTTQPPETGDQGGPSGECEQSDAASVSSGELFQCDQDVNYSNKVRQNMSGKGLYNKHDVSDPLLNDFAKYLQTELLKVSNRRLKMLHSTSIMQTQRHHPFSLSMTERSSKSTCMPSEAKLKKQTQKNYLKSLKRFLNYHTVSTNLRKMDMALHTECMEFIEYIGSLQREISKHVGKEITQKRHNRLIKRRSINKKRCLAVLDAAKKDFLDVMENLSESPDPLEFDQSILLVYYLEALIILKPLQRPGMVVHMTESVTVFFWSASKQLALTF
ncbi:uncharacterized protein LOC115579891 isoform X2 [Sparus aurata]|uniref:uncharacterized protein LOC115579891 isoform X2 n=1 Tax=Sparus aurata TaxID=8175 RepID=UPI0011C0E805|nr:uncharacterized protein LOC115579891 isoform X2 [Sparus aurata]